MVSLFNFHLFKKVHTTWVQRFLEAPDCLKLIACLQVETQQSPTPEGQKVEEEVVRPSVEVGRAATTPLTYSSPPVRSSPQVQQ